MPNLGAIGSNATFCEVFYVIGQIIPISPRAEDKATFSLSLPYSDLNIPVINRRLRDDWDESGSIYCLLRR